MSDAKLTKEMSFTLPRNATRSSRLLLRNGLCPPKGSRCTESHPARHAGKPN